MNTQTFAQAQNIAPITDEQLIAVNGGGVGATLGWAFANVFTLGIPLIVDSAKGGSVTKAAADY